MYIKTSRIIFLEISVNALFPDVKAMPCLVIIALDICDTNSLEIALDYFLFMVNGNPRSYYFQAIASIVDLRFP